MREEKYQSPFYYAMDPFERFVHDTTSPYVAEGMYWGRESAEILDMYQGGQEAISGDNEYYYDYPDGSTSSGNSKEGLIIILGISIYLLMVIAVSLLLAI